MARYNAASPRIRRLDGLLSETIVTIWRPVHGGRSYYPLQRKMAISHVHLWDSLSQIWVKRRERPPLCQRFGIGTRDDCREPRVYEPLRSTQWSNGCRYSPTVADISHPAFILGWGA